jgi:hypothetical protein
MDSYCKPNRENSRQQILPLQLANDRALNGVPRSRAVTKSQVSIVIARFLWYTKLVRN